MLPTWILGPGIIRLMENIVFSNPSPITHSHDEVIPELFTGCSQ